MYFYYFNYLRTEGIQNNTNKIIKSLLQIWFKLINKKERKRSLPCVFCFCSDRTFLIGYDSDFLFRLAVAIMRLVRTQCFILLDFFIFISSDGHMLMEYQIYPILPSRHATELAFEVVFTLRCFYFIVLLC